MARRAAVGALLSTLSAAFVASVPARAQKPPITGEPDVAKAGVTPRACTRGTQGALREIACELGNALSQVPKGALVVAAPMRSDVQLSAPQALPRRIASIIAGTLGRGARSAQVTANLSRARALAEKAGTLVHLKLELVSGELRVTADVLRAPDNFWDRVRDPHPDPMLHAFVSRRIDAEVRTFLPAAPLVVSRVDKATTDVADPVAVTCGDLGNDGTLDLVLVGRRRIISGRVRDGRLKAEASMEWKELSPVAATPLREPLASAWVHDGVVDVGISDRARFVRLDAALRVVAYAPRRVPWPTGGCSAIDGLFVAPRVEPCLPGDAAPPIPKFIGAADAIAGGRWIEPNGEARVALAARLANQTTVAVRVPGAPGAELTGLGAQLALADVNGDGQVELLSGADTADPNGDALIVHTIGEGGRAGERLRLAVPGGVRALAVCPPVDGGLRPIVVATAGQLWIVR